MLRRLHVRNFAIVDEVEVELERGMTVLTGETGAGKSILVDALGLVLGERGGAGLTRTGSRRAEFSAEFDVSDQPQAREWLAGQSLDLDDECLLRRVIGDDGRSRAFINGNAVPLTSLKTLGEMLLDIHGQHFHQSLGRPAVQRDLLDHYGGLLARREAVGAAFAAWQTLTRRLAALEGAEADRASRLDLLSFQSQELEALDLQPGEHDDLRAERERFRHGAQLVESVTGALGTLSENDEANVQALLAAAAHRLETAAAIDARLEPVQRLIEDAGIQVAEAADALQRYGESLDADPERRDWVEERLAAVQAIARKHRVEPEELPPLRERLLQQVDELANAEATGARLRKEAGAARTAFTEAAEALSIARRKAANAFAADVTGAMQGLGMPEGAFEIELRRRKPEEAGPSGLDEIAYLISANAGQPPMPLSKVASGGELSRMSLAVQVVASDGSAIPTMVFDEVDAGVGGGVAEMVGRRLMALGESRQVLCVTHLPQVASLADDHFRVLKLSDGKATRTTVARLSDNERVEEIARMLGGVKITQRTRDHAAEMLASSSRKPKKAAL
ncbi:MAG TPA: DNA repair protein RecN [Woeseiaceae bacterium]|nr:DNA repair protein RecN [Woeseiaceae bacterium]